jgi:hypothetical protein
MEFDWLRPDDIVWESYTTAAMAKCAPLGLSLVCTQYQRLWRATTAMAFDTVI